ncbi:MULTISPECIES: hypothetical protein [unclassified Streptomyces]|uniref:hypothetical protein n=1 Tax=unclassified Streptomyces TaxID=2593676 RepID=UPI00343AD619
MRIRRILAAVIATTALAGLSLTGAATATAATQGAPSYVSPDRWVTPEQCREGGGTQEGFDCKGGKYDGQGVD